MKPGVKQSSRKAAFTIIELLTVMSVIIILIGLLVPALNMVKRFAKSVTQKNRFHGIEVALETFNAEWEEYPDSSDGGAAKLCEAMVGQDLMGYDPDGSYSHLTHDLSNRRLYLKPESADAYRIDNLYQSGDGTGDLRYVLCDVYTNITYRSTNLLDKMNGRNVGMPILYYKADSSGNLHDPELSPSAVLPPDVHNFYDYRDNQALIRLGVPWDPKLVHPLLGSEADEGKKFYEITKNEKIEVKMGRPYRQDSYILISAGFDGLYGTNDDMFNFRN